MRRSSLVVLLACLLVNSAFAATDWLNQIGQWNEDYKWSNGVPIGDEEIRLRGDDSLCVLSSVQTWSDLSNNRTRVYEGATLIITDGGELTGPGWLRVGASNAGTIYQTGGLLKLQEGKDNTRLVIGDSGGSDGHYTISGGTLTYESGDGHLTLGDRGGTGTFTVWGSGSTIQMNSLRVGGRDSGRAATGTLEFLIDELGVTPIQVNDVILDPAGDDSMAGLIVDLIGIGDGDLVPEYLLVDNTGDDPVEGIFDGMPEGTTLTLDTTPYYLTYVGGTGNDIMLVPEPATVVLLGLGGLIATVRRPRKK